jgi:hypothetical protein
MKHDARPVLIIGYGEVARQTALALKLLQPDISIVASGRNLEKARRFADEVGAVDAVFSDVAQAGLGLKGTTSYGAVVPMVKDSGLHAFRRAQDWQSAFIAFSEFAYDVAPFVAQHTQRPDRAALLLLGHFLGGLATMAALSFSKNFASIDVVDIVALFDPDELGDGGSARGELDGAAANSPGQLLKQGGEWTWSRSTRTVLGVGGAHWQTRGFSLLDSPSLAAATGAGSVRIDYVVAPSSSSRAGGKWSHELVIDLVGIDLDGSPMRERHELVNPRGYRALSGLGAALAIERMVGKAGARVVPPGIYNPENILDPDYVLRRMVAFDTDIASRRTAA